MSIFWLPQRRNSVRSNDPAMNMSVGEATSRLSEEQSRHTDERLDQLLLVSAAMWELVRERTGLTEEDLLAKVAEVDARDGTLDGRITQRARVCPHCQHKVLSRHLRCLYCGGELGPDESPNSAFSSI